MTAFERASEIERESTTRSYVDGQRIVAVLLDGRDQSELSRPELKLLLRGFNWWGKHGEACQLAMSLLGPSSSLEEVRGLYVYLQNGMQHDISKLLDAFDSFIANGYGPAAFWHLKKADWYILMSTGDLELDFPWEPGFEMLHPKYLPNAAEEIKQAVEADSMATSTYEFENGWHWDDRFAALVANPEYEHLRLGKSQSAEKSDRPHTQP